ncbi:MAG: universal stress protein [Ferruginibacter sp.]|nr:universal stress protein [Ferruginibacter sp.]
MKTILVPTDFSKNALDALGYAIPLAESTGARLLIFHCAQLSAYALAGAPPDKLEEFINSDELFKMKLLREHVVKAYAAAGIKTMPGSTKLLVENNPLLVEKIMEVALRHEADLIITGTRGATGWGRFFFGSNTSALIGKSSIPVLAIPPGCKFKKIKKIAWSADLENLQQEMKMVLPFAENLHASVDVLYLDYGTDAGEAHLHVAKKLIGDSVYKKISLVRKKATIEFTMIRQLKKILSKRPYQLLVMFTKERGFWEKLLYGGKTEEMSYELELPLLSMRKQLPATVSAIHKAQNSLQRS